MSCVFVGLRRRLTARNACNMGFAIYWIGWCLAVPLWVLGPRTTARLLTAGRRPSAGDFMLLALPVAGAVSTRLVPRVRDIDAATGAAMVASALVNAVGEELLWRGVFMEELADRRRLAMVWSVIGFSAWHLAPQLVLPVADGAVSFRGGLGGGRNCGDPRSVALGRTALRNCGSFSDRCMRSNGRPIPARSIGFDFPARQCKRWVAVLITRRIGVRRCFGGV